MNTRLLVFPAILVALVAASNTPARLDLPQAPAPRAVEETRVPRAAFAGDWSHKPDTEEVVKILGVEWGINTGVRRLVSTGWDVIEFKWSMKYIGRRAPLMIRKPSLTDGFPGDTKARIYAFPPGKDWGRMVIFTPPEDDGLLSRIIFNGTPAEWWLEVKRGRTATGNETILVADLKERLRTLYPAEFPADKPPKLYAEFIHKPTDRGGVGHLDAWTGELGNQFQIEIPDLKSW